MARRWWRQVAVGARAPAAAAATVVAPGEPARHTLEARRRTEVGRRRRRVAVGRSRRRNRAALHTRAHAHAHARARARARSPARHTREAGRHNHRAEGRHRMLEVARLLES